MDAREYEKLRQLFDDYLRMYSSRDDRLTTHFSEDFSGFTGGGDFLVKDREKWVQITRLDFAQIKDPIHIELKDLAIQSLAETIAVATGFFVIHLPIKDHVLSHKTARLVLIFRKEAEDWKISHSSISIPFGLVNEGEVYPMQDLMDRNQFLEELVTERTIQLSAANATLQRTNAELAREIAEHTQSEAENEKLEARNRQLQKAESLGRMAGAIAHHFNNQLLVVGGNLEVAMMELGRGVNPSEKITAAMEASNKAAEMSGLMLTYLGESFHKQERMDLSEICRRGIPALQALTSGEVELDVDLPVKGPMVLGNAEQIMQVLTNLITNAAEAISDQNGKIRLSLRTVYAMNIPAMHRFPLDSQTQSYNYAYLEVTDSGCGIEAKDIEKLFDPFFSSKSAGRGMGLAVVLGIVRAHSGLVIVESEPTRGSKFRVYFPVLPETAYTE